MIDVTIKTLDSKNHSYSVPDNITVKQFKERIASSVSLPAEKQRLIYCGRVLNDDKNLSDYDVHEKVIHLVMRAPPESSNNLNRQSNDSGSTHNSSRHRQPVPSSSAIRLQQAKSMLDNAAEYLNRLESADSSREPVFSTDTDDSCEPTCPNSSNVSMASRGSSVSERNFGACTSQQCSVNDEVSSRNPEPESARSSELDNMYREIDALNNVAPLGSGPELLAFGIDTPLVSAMNNFQGGMAHAASAAFASALSSLGVNPRVGISVPSISVIPSTSSSPQLVNRTNPISANSTSRTVSYVSQPLVSSQFERPQETITSNASDASEQFSSNVLQQQSRNSDIGNQYDGGIRGITLRITNRSGAHNSTGILEHPRYSVMVQVLNQYREVQRRLNPFLELYYQIFLSDANYEHDLDRIRTDQLIFHRVSTVLHFLSHALHAISDILIDLRMNPPRQLRARPFIIPQPAIVQAQINVSPDESGSMQMDYNESTNSERNDIGDRASVQQPVASISSTERSGGISLSRESFLPVPEEHEEESEVVLMHVEPNGITIDSIPEDVINRVSESGSNPQSELIQNLMSLSSVLGIQFSEVSNPVASHIDSSLATLPSGVRRSTPIHNSQATGNSGTNTTNSTQTRVTPRAQQLHVSPIQLPGMSRSQFDPFLPCQSHHLPPLSSRRRRHAASMQGNTLSAATAINEVFGRTARTSNRANPNNVTVPFSENVNQENSDGNRFTTQEQQEQMLSHLVQAIMAEVRTTLTDEGPIRSPRRQLSLHQFLEPFSTGLFPESERDSIFTALLTTLSEALSMEDIVQVFFGNYSSLNRITSTIQEFVRCRILNGQDPTEENMNTAIDSILIDIDPNILEAMATTSVLEGIDYVNTVRNFLRHRLHDIFNLVLSHGDANNFGFALVSLLQRSCGEFSALSLHCFSEGSEGFERFIHQCMRNILSGMSTSIQSWTINTSLLQLRTMMERMNMTDDSIRHYIVSHDEGGRMERVREVQSAITNGGRSRNLDASLHAHGHQNELEDQVSGEEMAAGIENKNESQLNGSESSVFESFPSEGYIPRSTNVSSTQQSWQSVVPTNWIPVVTRDVEYQRRIAETNLSDAYTFGMPLKRRKIVVSQKVNGSTENVFQDTLRRSLENADVNGNLVESLPSHLPADLIESFAVYTTIFLREELQNNINFNSSKFPKAQKLIFKK